MGEANAREFPPGMMDGRDQCRHWLTRERVMQTVVSAILIAGEVDTLQNTEVRRLFLSGASGPACSHLRAATECKSLARARLKH
jgi:hypothetical protein